MPKELTNIEDDDIVMIYGDLDSDLVKKAKPKPAPVAVE